MVAAAMSGSERAPGWVCAIFRLHRRLRPASCPTTVEASFRDWLAHRRSSGSAPRAARAQQQCGGDLLLAGIGQIIRDGVKTRRLRDFVVCQPVPCSAVPLSLGKLIPSADRKSLGASSFASSRSISTAAPASNPAIPTASINNCFDLQSPLIDSRHLSLHLIKTANDTLSARSLTSTAPPISLSSHTLNDDHIWPFRYNRGDGDIFITIVYPPTSYWTHAKRLRFKNNYRQQATKYMSTR
uniref:Uncharacterized protein n=1 Tax=Plectus sambesii TaxID=2011161 RepID=A0A914WG14_9BILA